MNYARLLSEAYAGNDSELAAILQYTYGHIVTDGERPEQLSPTLACVSETEMKHFEILGDLIFKLGGDPKFCDSVSHRCFDAGKVKYQPHPERLNRAAIAGERTAIALYRELMRKIDDECVRAILRRIILDEEHHIKIFSELSSGER
jgi:bacterioferritin